MTRDKNAPHYTSVRQVRDAPTVLWDLLEERPREANISHKAMPTADEHLDFVSHHPYRAWYLIKVRGEWVGSVYVTRHFEIGVAILKAYQGKGYGTHAINEMVRRWAPHVVARPSVQRKAMLANISPNNPRSAKLFEAQGFKHVMNVFARDIE